MAGAAVSLVTVNGGLFADQTWREWLLARRSPKTTREYSSDLQRTFAKYLAGRSVSGLAELRPEDIVSYPAWLREQGLAPATRARKMASMRVALRYAYALGYVSPQVAAMLELTKSDYVSDVSPRFPLDKSEVRAILAAVNTRTVKGQRDHAMLAFFLYLALRSQELSDLTLGCFHRNGDYLVLQFTGKYGKVRELPVRPQLSESLRAYLAAEQRDCDLLHVPADRAGERLFRPYHVRRGDGKEDTNAAITTRGLRKLAAHYAAKADITCDLHTLRLTAATNAIEAGADLDRVQDYMGHSDIRTTRRYVKRHQGLRDSAAHLINY